jgi:hypothetical protein
MSWSAVERDILPTLQQPPKCVECVPADVNRGARATAKVVSGTFSVNLCARGVFATEIRSEGAGRGTRAALPHGQQGPSLPADTASATQPR